MDGLLRAGCVPDRVSLLHKGGESYMAQRVRIPYRGQSPSSVTQLPILTALHARCPTLFALIIHDMIEKVNPFFWNFKKFSLTRTGNRPLPDKPRFVILAKGGSEGKTGNIFFSKLTAEKFYDILLGNTKDKHFNLEIDLSDFGSTPL